MTQAFEDTVIFNVTCTGALLSFSDGDKSTCHLTAAAIAGLLAIKGGMMRLINLTKLLAFCTVVVSLALPVPAQAL